MQERSGESFTEDYPGYRTGFLVKRIQFFALHVLCCSDLYLILKEVASDVSA